MTLCIHNKIIFFLFFLFVVKVAPVQVKSPEDKEKIGKNCYVCDRANSEPDFIVTHYILLSEFIMINLTFLAHIKNIY